MPIDARRVDRVAGHPRGRGAADLTLGGLLDVLDRVDAAPERRRSGPPRATAVRPTAVRPVPVPRPRPAPPARAATPGPAGRPPATAAAPARPGLLRRLALWGAGPSGAHLARGRAAPPVPGSAVPLAHPGAQAARPSTPPALRPGAGARLRAVTRRLALWGAGPSGAHLAWGRPAPAAPRTDGPVLLTELPSTPTTPPVARRPAAAHRPARVHPAAPPARPRVPVVAPLARQQPAARPTPAPATAVPGRSAGRPRVAAPRRRATPAAVRGTPARGAHARAVARSRGDPRPPPARGSPAR
ncbi:hypothetical protein [Geodermatophilus marinus]|uniref:hypothetical protein n=1 Tax=Geodermatophilus sp. LHW52908 TaxID=2303986 RepID=UPI000E3D6C77|nr:hypothetical protein [Geodermatophilus sp. LHW52908]RFU20241.1 hypothetical protein D0Z06_17400 [Geodermatophilus sp. LHW52908]